MRWFKDILTEIDNKTFDLHKVTGLSGAVGFQAFEAHSVLVNHQPFDPISYGTGFGAVVAAVGAALALNRKNQTIAPPDAADRPPSP